MQAPVFGDTYSFSNSGDAGLIHVLSNAHVHHTHSTHLRFFFVMTGISLLVRDIQGSQTRLR